MKSRNLQQSKDREAGRLASRPGEPRGGSEHGVSKLDLDDRRDGLLFVPSNYSPQVAAPLLLMLHGAGGTAKNGLDLVQATADALGVVVLSPQSRHQTWDVIASRYGPDVAFIDKALAAVFDRIRIDPDRVAVGGFSDGASYALSLGLMNGDLFGHVLAFSPGFMAPLVQLGDPHIFISHGDRDQVLPVEVCSRRLVPQLKSAGYEVEYDEFPGGHQVPSRILAFALGRFAGQPARGVRFRSGAGLSPDMT